MYFSFFAVSFFYSVCLKKLLKSLEFYLVEAEEVLDGRGCVEDVSFSRHHQHEAVQRLKTKDKLCSELRVVCVVRHTICNETNVLPEAAVLPLRS